MLIAFANVAQAYDFSYTYQGQTLYYDILPGAGNTVTVARGVDISGGVYIPSEVSNGDVSYTVVSIGNGAFVGCANLTSVSMPNTIRVIDTNAFSGCQSLISVTFSNTLQEIRYGAFYNCRFTPVFPSSLKTIGSSAFEYNRIYQLVIPDSVTNIGANAFSGSNYTLRDVTIGKRVRHIGSWAFGYSSINIIRFNGTIDEWCKVQMSEILFTGNPNNISSAGRQFYYVPDAENGTSMLLTELVIPNSIDTVLPYSFAGMDCITSVTIHSNVKYIGTSAFSGLKCPITNNSQVMTYIGDEAFWYCDHIVYFQFPATLQHIGNSAFYQCSELQSVDLPNSVTYVGASAFSGCTHLVYVRMSDAVSIIKEQTFNGCSLLDTVVLGTNVDSIEYNAFNGCYQLKSINLPTSLKKIKNQAFYGCSSLHEVTIPESVQAIESRAFYSAGIQKLHYNARQAIEISEWRSYSHDAYSSWYEYYSPFYGCPIDTVVVGNSANVIPSGMFSGNASIKSILLGDSVTTINNEAFHSCSSLNNMVFPSSVTSMGQHILWGTAVDTITMLGTIPPTLNPYCFYNTYSTTIPGLVVFVPCEAFHIYQQAQYWSNLNIQRDTSCSNTITAVAADPTTGSVSGGGRYSEGDTVILTAIPVLHYRFKMWNDSVTDNPRTIIMEGDSVLFAIFELDEYTSIVTPSNPSMGGTIGGGTFLNGYIDTLYALPKYNYRFMGWDDGNTNNPRYVQVIADTNYIALFASADTIYIHDTTYIDVPYAVHDTTVVTDTVTMTEYVPVHDTTYIDVHDTTYIDVPYAVHDTTVVTDTVTLTEYVPVHDTTYIDVHDTTYIDVPVHDTTIVTDTVTMTEYVPVHDTTYIDVHDTTYIDVPYVVHDTTIVTDTVTMTEYVPVHDTTVVTDTVTLTQYDTITNTVYDTIDNFVYDTLTVTDTFWLHDTIIIHDTVYITEEGVDGVDALNAKVYSSQGQIIVEGAEDNRVTLYDINGRALATKQDYATAIRFDAPASGTYMIKIGNHAARKVVVIR